MDRKLFLCILNFSLFLFITGCGGETKVNAVTKKVSDGTQEKL